MFRSMMNFASASGDFCSNDNECHCIIIFPGGRLSKNVLARLLNRMKFTFPYPAK